MTPPAAFVVPATDASHRVTTLMVSIGAGVTSGPLTWPAVIAALCGLAVSLTLWWVYFDVVALVVERVLTRLVGDERTRSACDSYTYLYFPMLLAIVYSALGLKKVLGSVFDTGHHGLGDALPWVPVLAMYVGVSVYLFALGTPSTQHRRVTGSDLRWRRAARAHPRRRAGGG